MSKLVDPGRIEAIVGVARHPSVHYARAVSAEATVYILHSQQCKDSGIDLRECAYSLAMDQGIDLDRWMGDVPVPVTVNEAGYLLPWWGQTS
jgi:hypothetical protein